MLPMLLTLVTLYNVDNGHNTYIIIHTYIVYRFLWDSLFAIDANNTSNLI